MSDVRELWLWLAASGITPRQFDRLIDEYGSVEGIGDAFAGYAVRERNARITPSALQRLREARRPEAMFALERAMDRWSIQLVTREDQGYPPLLRFLEEDAPIALFVRGQIELCQSHSFAIVGTRQCTRYGEQASHRIAAGLAAAGVTVVSGMARGIDTAAHMGCLSVGGRTVAVLGGGVDVMYPPENASLIHRVIDEGGAVVSEYAPGSPPLAGHFPVRNRIVSGMCSGVLVVEAGAHSGAMITTRNALAQGREVYALPGPVDSPNSAMPLMLLREGGQMATDAQDILQSIRWLDEQEDMVPEMAVSATKRSLTTQRKPPDPAPPEPSVSKSQRALEALSPAQRRVAEALQRGDLIFSEILVRTGLSTPELNSHLTMLELQGIIVQLPGRIYALAK